MTRPAFLSAATARGRRGPRSGPGAALIAAALAMIAALAGVFTMPVLDRDEARFAQATAQMLESGDPVRIRFLDQPRHKKPAGIHWMQAASVGLLSTAEAREIWAYRLPSVLGAGLAAFAVTLLGGALLGARAGFAGGLLIAVSVLLSAEGAIAKTDAMLAGLTALTMLAVVRVRLCADADAPPSRLSARSWAILAWGAAALAILVKGPVTPMVVGLAMAVLLAWERRIDWLKPFFFWPGPVLAAGLLIPWFAAVQILTDGAFMAEALGQDLGPKLVSGHEGHGAPPGGHLALLPVLAFPMIVVLPAGLAAAVKGLSAGPARARAARIAIALLIPGFLAFELTPTKLPHYTLPLHPPIAVLAGWGIAVIAAAPLWSRLAGAALGLVGAGVLAALLAGLALGFDAPAGFAVLTGLATGAAALIAGLAALIRARRAALLAALAAGLVWTVGARGLVAPGADALFLARGVEAELDAAGLAPERLHIVSTFTEPSLVFTLGGAITLAAPSELGAALEAPTGRDGRLVVIDATRYEQAMEDAQGAGDPHAVDALRAHLERLSERARALGEVRGLNYSRGDDTTVLLLHIPPEPEGDAP